ncbi:DUF5357 family protein [Stenomitos frigidus]|uniref:DUF5357 domain-containing protein n=1 Tax=Stenomitos frigidus ULC18 TaxID=2107698 RepID=A0A2T1EDS3_9CYAN|nr:DUF5357 family protein [Stenomitos frigidus]PSB30851.1 hypothetical protein C7B82_07940 [Stenomitos frigidus ULC18]
MADFFNFLGQFFRALIPPSFDSWQTVFWVVLLTVIIANLVFRLAVGNLILSILSIDEIFKELRKTLTPPKPDSWQSLLWISIFSWAMSLLPESLFIQGFIATCAWFFLIPGVHWFLHEEKFEVFKLKINVKKGLTVNGIWLGPWITGALVCLLLFSELPENRISIGFICWPPISAIIAALPKFIAVGPHYKTPDPAGRQELVILLLTNLLVSCWFQLFFLTQSWLVDYPSLLTEDLSRSAFVVKFTGNRPSSRGATILDQAETIVKEQLDGQPWSQAERWLFDLKPRMQQVEATVMSRLPLVKENELWQLDGQVLPRTEYQLQLMAIWQGPSADGSGYYLMKPCQITRLSDPRRSLARTVTSTQIARVTCDAVTTPKAGQPDVGI